MAGKITHFVSYLMVLVAIMLLLGCSNASMNKEYKASDVYEEAMADSIAISDEKSFALENDSLHLENLKAFEKRAIQKLEDFTDYLEILSDTTVELAFKEQAKNMAFDIFSSNAVSIALFLNRKQGDREQSLELFIQNVESNQFGKLLFDIHYVKVARNLEKTNENIYKGTLQFRIFVYKDGLKKHKLLNHFLLNAGFELKKIQKDFGNETKDVWEVFLKDISSGN